MSTKLSFAIASALIGTAGIVAAQGVNSPRDPYSQGAAADTRDPYSQGARADKFDPYTEGANKSTKQQLAPTANGQPDPYTQGGRTGARDPYSEGARTLNRDYPYDTQGHVQDSRSSFFNGGD
jgi:hypothetical protein